MDLPCGAMVKNPANAGDATDSLDWEDPLEQKGYYSSYSNQQMGGEIFI